MDLMKQDSLREEVLSVKDFPITHTHPLSNPDQSGIPKSHSYFDLDTYHQTLMEAQSNKRLRRMSCHCSECGSLSHFQFVHILDDGSGELQEERENNSKGPSQSKFASSGSIRLSQFFKCPSQANQAACESKKLQKSKGGGSRVYEPDEQQGKPLRAQARGRRSEVNRHIVYIRHIPITK